MQTLQLADALFDDLLSGTKRCTIRKGHRPLAAGPLRFEGTARSVEVRVTHVLHKAAWELTDEEARSEGMSDAAALIESLRRFYPDLQPDDVVTVVHFAGAGPAE